LKGEDDLPGKTRTWHDRSSNPVVDIEKS
jgi:hypothetical protein